MTQLLPSAPGGEPQAPRNVLRPDLRCILIVVFTLVCLLALRTGTSEAGGRRGGGSGRRASPTHSRRPNYGHKHHHRYKHKHMRGAGDGGDGSSGGADSGGGEDAEGQDSGGAAGIEGAQDSGGAVVESEKAEGARYGMEITTLYKGTAAKEGLGIGDIILKVNGTPTPTFEALAQALAQAGGRAEVLVIREDDDDEKPATVTLFPQKGIIGVSVERVRVD